MRSNLRSCMPLCIAKFVIFLPANLTRIYYEYDQNGNMTKDMNRDIAEIEYNLLNLPTMIRYQNGSRVSYIYAATGEKLRVDHGINVAPVLDPAAQTAQPASIRGGMPPVDPTPADSTFVNYVDKTRVDYCGNMIYDRGVRRLLTDEGYVTFASDGTPQYHYYLRDHLGSIRVVMAQDGTVEQKTHYYPFGGIMYGSTGQGVQPYKYGGKELDRANGLDAYDFGARMYFADRAQWMTMDPLCEKYYSVSPYAYCANNPVMLVDPEGKDVYTISETGIIMRESENDKVDLLVSNDGMNMAMFSLGFIEQFTSDRDDYNGHYGNTTNIDDAVSLFMFAARNTDVEWAISSYYQKDGNLNFLVYTSHSDEGVTFTNGNFEFKNIHAHIHSHPRNTGIDKASGDYSQMYDSQKNKYKTFESDDLFIINKRYLEYEKIYPNKVFHRDYPIFYIYNAKTNNFFSYDHHNSYIPVK